ncbi:hypothetical protein CDAR_595901 [Caerostris darwini]|uniref:Uncharacterized protein n=1 Tax=Caerostris darwini TaxID=1538125 RepID=A0AAV4Q5R3_9ARAC|nr:hypothetical protein CDAR_595901 [Caerostris darwini]
MAVLIHETSNPLRIHPQPHPLQSVSDPMLPLPPLLPSLLRILAGNFGLARFCVLRARREGWWVERDPLFPTIVTFRCLEWGREGDWQNHSNRSFECRIEFKHWWSRDAKCPISII